MVYVTLSFTCITFYPNPHLMGYHKYCGSGCACNDVREKLDATMTTFGARRVMCYNNRASFACNYVFEDPPKDLTGLEKLFSDIVDVLCNDYDTFINACILDGDGHSGISIDAISSFHRHQNPC